MKAFLILEDGHVFKGTSIGSTREGISEIVFNTSMTGYLEVMTDPSYAGQAVCMTYPLIGNYGICYEDQESRKPWIDGFIVRELSRIPSNFRSVDTIQHFLEKHDIPGIAGIDTRALTKILREKGTMNGMITVNENYDLDEIIPRLKAYTTGKVVEKVTCSEKEVLKGNGPKVALMDFGAKRNIARSLNERGCQVTIYPALTSAEEILADHPDGIMLSNGPGDPKECTTIIEEIRKLYASDVPIFAICLGHQLMALATGGDTHKMKYGHRGGNHPVKDLATGRVYISSQNHGYVVDAEALEKKGNEIHITSKGKQLLELVPEDLKKAELTADWEKKLTAISKGKQNDQKFMREISDYTQALINDIKTSDGKFRHDNVTRHRCPECGKFLLEVNGKHGKRLVCQDRICGYKKTISKVTNARCPVCHKKMEMVGEGEGQKFVCVCGYKEKLSAFKQRKEKQGSGMSKKEVNRYLKKQQKEAQEPINNAFAEAFSKIKL